MTWRRTPCWGAPVDSFFLRARESVDHARPRLQEVARRLCAECPVRRECLDVGSAPRQYGMWGGVLFWPRKSSAARSESMLP